MAASKKTVKPVAVAKAEAPKAEKAVESVAKKVETPAVEVKTETKAARPAEKAAPAVKKETAKKETKPAAEKKTAKKASVKEAPAKEAELKSEVHIQFGGKSYAQEDLVKIAKDVWKYDLNQKVEDLTSVELYVKPEENAAYYVMNGQFTGSFGL